MKNSILSRFAATLGVFACFLVSVSAATYNVSNTNDTGAGSLRQAITDALGAAGPHDIQAGGVTGTISLQSALPFITNKTITIHGPTSGTLTVTRGVATNFRIFTVTNSGGAASLTINRLTMTNGNPGATGTDTGGGILCFDSTVNLSFCTISGCTSGGNGGGIHYDGNAASSGTVEFCTFSGNTAAGAGGGIASSSATSGTLTLAVNNSAITGNRAGAAGGGVTALRSTTTLRNCTISGNSSGFNGGGINVGASAGNLIAINCTVTNNSTDTGSGGGIRSSGTGSFVSLINTLVVGNVLTGTGADDTSWGTASTRTAKNSVVGVHGGTAYNTTTASQIGTSGSPKVVNLGALANNGGPTQTHALLATVPELAIDMGSTSDVTTVASDQRGTGYDRVMGGTVDIGAFESGAVAPTFTGVTPLGAPIFYHGVSAVSILGGYNAPPGTDRLLVVVVSDTNSLDITSVSFGGTPMTQAVERNDGFAVDSIWVLPLGTSTAAATGNITIAHSGTGDYTFIAAQAFQNVHQTTPVSATDSFEPATNATSVSRTIASATGDLVFDVLDAHRIASLPTLAPTASNGQAVVHSAGSAIGAGFDCYKTSLKPGAASVNMSWTTSSENTLYLAVNLKQAAGALSNNADLSGLALTTATINETFAANTTSYTSSVPNATSSVTVTATRADANATIQARVGANAFASVTSGSPSASLALAEGPNTIEVKVTAQDGTTTKTYSIVVTRAAPVSGVTQLGSPSGQFTTSSTLSFTVPAGTDRLLVVSAGDPGSVTVPSAVSFGPTPMLLANSAQDLGFSNDSIWYLKLGSGAADTRTITVSFNGSDKRFIGAVAFSGVDQTTPVDINGPRVTGSVTGANLSSTLNVTSQVGDRVFDLFDAYHVSVLATTTPGANQTLIDDHSGSFGGGTSHYSTSSEGGAATVAMEWTSTAGAILHVTMNINGNGGGALVAPTVTTATQSAVAATSATLGGNVTADGGASVTERGIVWGTSTGPTTANNKVQNGSGTGAFSATVNSLPAGTTVFVRAYAINSVNTSYGSEISFTTLNVPGAPTIGTATAGNTTASVAFTAPASNGGSAITGYTVTASPGGATGTGTVSPITVNGLTNGTAYTFTVKATNSVGDSSASAASNSVTPATVPGAPTIGTATAGTTANATVTFTAPASDGGSPITSYSVTSAPGGVVNVGATSPITVSGLTPGIVYTFTVQAFNAIGPSALSAASNSITAVAVPGAPTIGTATAGNASASVAFTAPASNGGSAILDYTATSSPGGITATGSGSPISVTGLTNGTPYTFTVTARNAVGTGAASGAANSVTPMAAADIPLNLTGGALTIDASGSGGAANVTLRYVTGPGGPFLEITDTSRTLEVPAGGSAVNSNTVRVPLSSITSLVLNGRAGAPLQHHQPGFERQCLGGHFYLQFR